MPVHLSKKHSENKTKSIKDQGRKRFEAFLKQYEEEKPKSIKDIFLKDSHNNELKKNLKNSKQ